ncbi:MAG TPA: CPBP family intramembrane glutamic endopeptidase [Anaerolineae bacterium]|nr:CPBP family intramembrane glutamic endopeptidase [Anaerolineae bacterium]
MDMGQTVSESVGSGSFHWGMFVGLWLLGMAGVVSLLAAPLAVPAGQELPFSEGVMKVIGFIQSGVFLAVLVGVGTRLAPQLGLRAPFIETVGSDQPAWSVLGGQLLPAVVGGVVAGVLIVGLARLAMPFLPADYVEMAANVEIPLAARFLYGGITEELMLRWGLMTLIAWGLWRVAGSGVGAPAGWMMVVAIVIAAFLFGVGHLPALYGMVASPTTLLIMMVIGLNMVGGLIYGWLYWQKGLEAAFIAHMMTHVVMVASAAVMSSG